MLSTQIISPVDGSIFAERAFSTQQAVESALSSAKLAQAKWKGTSVAERGAFCLAIVDAMLAMKDDIVPELAWQMGRPVRYGAGEVRGFKNVHGI